MRGDLAHGLPVMPGKAWLVRASESGYLTADDWYLVCAHLKMHIMYRPAFVLFDGYVHHFDADALAMLVEDQILHLLLEVAGLRQRPDERQRPERLGQGQLLPRAR
mmetsp:Transcript_10505/g.27343  ORF Transcript_10505/g.27343 Transcript_10505/m.27343 type:complete len:106 (+) Transcript_10505:460-777(+)